MNLWQLPVKAVIGGREYPIHADYRDILEIIARLQDPDKPELLRWYVALALFYDGEIPRENRREAMEYLAAFIACGEQGRPGPKLLDWEQDAGAIIAGVNRAAGMEIRSLPFLHWWSFLAFFHAIGEGQLSALVSVRDKLRRGKPLEPWERQFYRENKAQVDLKPRYSAAELAEKARLEKLLE